MKIKKSTIIWFAVAVFLVVCGLFGKTGGESPGWNDATYVKDAKVLPENEGKIVAISGNFETTAYAKDTLIGVNFKSPWVIRNVEQLRWAPSSEEWVKDYNTGGKSDDGFEKEDLFGSIKIGEFEIDKDLIKTLLAVSSRDAKEEDFSDEDIKHMNEEGHVISDDFKCYYSTGPLDYRNLKESDYIHHPEWDGAYLVSWKIWQPEPDEGATVVGVQKGSTLTRCDLNTPASTDKIMDENAFKEAANPKDASSYANIFFFVLALFCAVMGVRSLFKEKKKKE